MRLWVHQLRLGSTPRDKIRLVTFFNLALNPYFAMGIVCVQCAFFDFLMPAFSPTPSQASIPLGWLILLGLLTAMGPLAVDMYLPAFSSIAISLNTDPSAVERTLASYLLGIGVAQLLYGPVADRFGRKIPLMVGLCLFIVASIACASSQDIHHLTLWRVVQAFGGAAGMAIPRAIIRDHYDTQDAARALSLLMLIMGATPILAPTLGAQLLRFTSWQTLFFIMAGAGCLLLLATLRFLQESLAPSARQPLHLRHVGRNYVELFQSRSFLCFSLAGAFGSAGMFAYISGSARVFVGHFNISPAWFGALFGLNAAALIIASQVGARLLGRYTPLQLMLWAQHAQVGFALIGLALSLSSGLNLTLLMLCLMGFMATQGFINPNSAALALSEQGRRLGIASALLGALQMLFGALAGFAVSAWANSTALPLTTALAVCAVASWFSGRIASKNLRKA